MKKFRFQSQTANQTKAKISRNNAETFQIWRIFYKKKTTENWIYTKILSPVNQFHLSGGVFKNDQKNDIFSTKNKKRQSIAIAELRDRANTSRPHPFQKYFWFQLTLTVNIVIIIIKIVKISHKSARVNKLWNNFFTNKKILTKST